MGYKHKNRARPVKPIWYGGRLFKPVQTEGASETTGETVFKYEQFGTIVTATYSGGDIEFGQLIATVKSDFSLDMRYQHRNKDGELMTGICKSKPEVLDSGKLRLHERWQWTCRDKSRGTSILEEL